MTDEAKRTVEILRYCEDSGARCGGCPSGMNKEGIPNCHSQCEIAHLIESLSAELEQVKQERDGLNILLAQSQSMLATRTRERDAAVEDMFDFGRYSRSCGTCLHEAKNVTDEPCKSCDAVTYLGSNWQWRGLPAENGGGSACP